MGFLFSIIYHHIPEEEGLAPKTGSLLGDWEVDAIHKKGKVFEFLGLGPKSYGLAVRTPSGKIETSMKVKGVSLKLNTKTEFTYDNMKQLVLNDEVKEFKVTQTNFLNRKLETYTLNSKKAIQKSDYKGKVVGTIVYPYGHELDDGEEGCSPKSPLLIE